MTAGFYLECGARNVDMFHLSTSSVFPADEVIEVGARCPGLRRTLVPLERHGDK